MQLSTGAISTLQLHLSLRLMMAIYVEDYPFMRLNKTSFPLQWLRKLIADRFKCSREMKFLWLEQESGSRFEAPQTLLSNPWFNISLSLSAVFPTLSLSLMPSDPFLPNLTRLTRWSDHGDE